MKTNLVIGMGEIGTAMAAILECEGYDIKNKVLENKQYDVLHICFPYSEKFVHQVQLYKKYLGADLVIIHSTVPVGITEEVGDYAVHSPVRGVHPHLEDGIRTFTKYFGGERAIEASEQFPTLNTYCIVSSHTTELMKLVDTTLYGMNILMQKEIKRLCEKNNADYYTVYAHANATYNTGYKELGMPQFAKYNLKDYPGKIGGHCIMPNVELFDSWMCELLKEKNREL